MIGLSLAPPASVATNEVAAGYGRRSKARSGFLDVLRVLAVDRGPVCHRGIRCLRGPHPSPAPNHANSNTRTVDRFPEISVKEGQKVTEDQTIGKSTNTGNSRGARARYEERHDGKPHALIRSNEVQTKSPP
jgi:hypothetical protein